MGEKQTKKKKKHHKKKTRSSDSCLDHPKPLGKIFDIIEPDFSDYSDIGSDYHDSDKEPDVDGFQSLSVNKIDSESTSKVEKVVTVTGETSTEASILSAESNKKVDEVCLTQPFEIPVEQFSKETKSVVEDMMEDVSEGVCDVMKKSQTNSAVMDQPQISIFEPSDDTTVKPQNKEEIKHRVDAEEHDISDGAYGLMEQSETIHVIADQTHICVFGPSDYAPAELHNDEKHEPDLLSVPEKEGKKKKKHHTMKARSSHDASEHTKPLGKTFEIIEPDFSDLSDIGSDYPDSEEDTAEKDKKTLAVAKPLVLY